MICLLFMLYPLHRVEAGNFIINKSVQLIVLLNWFYLLLGLIGDLACFGCRIRHCFICYWFYILYGLFFASYVYAGKL